MKVCPLSSVSGVVQTCRKLWFSTVAVLGHVDDMPVVLNDRFLRCRRCGRRCDLAATSWALAHCGSASDSVRRAVRGLSLCATETGTHSAAVHGGGGDEGGWTRSSHDDC